METSHTMNQTLLDYFRCPERFVHVSAKGSLSSESGFFSFGTGVLAYGKYAGHTPAETPRGPLPDAWEESDCASGSVVLPFDLHEVAENLRLERYTEDCQYGSSESSYLARIYYALRPLLPVGFRRHLQRLYLGNWSKIVFPHWPVDHTVDSIVRGAMQLVLRSQKIETIPFIWFWPEGAAGGVCMTHDVETAVGRDFCESLMNLNQQMNIPASFQIVPEDRYGVSEEYLESIRRSGFEINVQDLNHDGRLYNDRKEFARRASRINQYGRRWGASGFRSAILYRRQEWYSDLEFSYDMSVPTSAHLEPQRGGCCTVMPYFVGKLLELPVTTTQDYSLFNYLRSFDLDLWKREIDLILEQNGLVSFIVHPDYITKEREKNLYQLLLSHLNHLRDERKVWVAAPGQIDQWWRQRSKMTLVKNGDGWRIEGEGSERASIAYASEEDGKLVFTKMSSAASGLSAEAV